jgi:hypothetical protein
VSQYRMVRAGRRLITHPHHINLHVHDGDMNIMYSSLLIIFYFPLGLGMVSDGDLALVIAEWDNYLDRET